MKLKLFILLILASFLASCVSTTITSPDGTVKKTTSTDPAVVTALAGAGTTIAISAANSYIAAHPGKPIPATPSLP
jgi:hypothetical protein